LNRKDFIEDDYLAQPSLLPKPNSEDEIIHGILRSVFISLPDFNNIFLYCPPEAVQSMSLIPWISNSFREIKSTSGDLKSKLFFCHRFDVVPELLIRQATVEGLNLVSFFVFLFLTYRSDNDDLLPIFESQHVNLEEKGGEYFLSHSIETQDSKNIILVAEVWW
jgi:hypothetical protein